MQLFPTNSNLISVDNVTARYGELPPCAIRSLGSSVLSGTAVWILLYAQMLLSMQKCPRPADGCGSVASGHHHSGSISIIWIIAGSDWHRSGDSIHNFAFFCFHTSFINHITQCKDRLSYLKDTELIADMPAKTRQ
jgi:hypothetical protein